MNIGQTSLVVFISKLLAAVLGFVATVYFARVLGAEIYGIFALVIALTAWLRMGGRAGIDSGIKKRISEGEEQGQYLTAGVVMASVLLLIVVLFILLMSNYIEAYVSGFEDHSTVSVIWYIIAIVILYIMYLLVNHTLKGEGLVHIAGVLRAVEVILVSLFQVALVALGYSIVGMLVGYAAGVVFVAVIGGYFITVRPRIPARRHFRSIYDYAKYAWLGALKSRSFNDVDILVLGFFVSQALVGVYAVAWSLSKFLDMFSTAVTQAVFPEISKVSAQRSKEEAVSLIEDSLAYTGLFSIPGLVGGVILDERLMRIYDGEFVRGTEVLWLLILSILFYGYLKQSLNALNALNRPDLAFKANLVFIGSNIVLNIFLIWQYGWIGAAVASAVSSLTGLLLAYGLLKKTVPVTLPAGEISRQAFAAIFMGVIVWSLLMYIESTDVLQNNFVIVIGLVSVGGVVYFSVLLSISRDFRKTVERNTPFDIPYLQ